jgi:FkbM family methyltransferase
MASTFHRRLVGLTETLFPDAFSNLLRQKVRNWRSTRARWRRGQKLRLWEKQNGRGDIVATLQPGVKIRLYCDSVVCRHIYLDDFECAERHFVNLFLRPGDVFVDAGANVGLFSLVAARRVRQNGMVFAFEPCAKTFGRLRENIELNRFRNVACLPVALSDEEKDMELIVSNDGLDAWNSFAQPHMGEHFGREKVICRTLDGFASERSLAGRITMIKIDVEGWESFVLRGGRATLSRPDAPVLQVEFTDEAARASGCTTQGVYQMLQEFGYRMFTFDPGSRMLVHDPLRASYPYVNLYAVKQVDCINRKLQQK